MTNNRSNQQIRGLCVDKDKIRPKLTKEQRKSMSVAEKKEYTAERLKEYRSQYNFLYARATYMAERDRIKEERETAYQFYKDYMAKQSPITA